MQKKSEIKLTARLYKTTMPEPDIPFMALENKQLSIDFFDDTKGNVTTRLEQHVLLSGEDCLLQLFGKSIAFDKEYIDHISRLLLKVRELMKKHFVK